MEVIAKIKRVSLFWTTLYVILKNTLCLKKCTNFETV